MTTCTFVLGLLGVHHLNDGPFDAADKLATLVVEGCHEGNQDSEACVCSQHNTCAACTSNECAWDGQEHHPTFPLAAQQPWALWKWAAATTRYQKSWPTVLRAKSDNGMSLLQKFEFFSNSKLCLAVCRLRTCVNI